VLVIINLTPVTRERYRLGVPRPGIYQPALCSDDPRYGGWGVKPVEAVAERKPFRDYKHSALFRVPPMSITIYTYKRNSETWTLRRNPLSYKQNTTINKEL
jgi:1,4-alpha-glucan branching enzyme